MSWLACVSYAHAKGALKVSDGWDRMGTLWQGITTIAFAFTSSSTLPLYASLKGSVSIVTTNPSRFYSFRSTSLLSVIIAVVFIFPLLLFSASSDVLLDAPDVLEIGINPFIALFNSITLLSAIPFILVTTPIAIPLRIRRQLPSSAYKIVLLMLIFPLSLLPLQASRVMSNMLLFMALSGTYLLPAVLHILAHYFKRPLTIIIPNSAGPSDGQPSPSNDELLQRKERALQRRQLKKRIVWDIGVWVSLVPIGGGGIVWATGKLAGKW